MHRTHRDRYAFTLIELLVVVAIISLLISILMPSLSRARDQGKGAHCLARFHEYGIAMSAYENVSNDQLPPALWSPGECCKHNDDVRYGWEELLFDYVYKEKIFVDGECEEKPDFPVQRNLDPERWDSYFLCKASSFTKTNAGHYRVYLPFWAYGTFGLRDDPPYVGRFDLTTGPDPTYSASRSSVSPKAILIGDSNEQSYRGDGDATNPHEGDDCSYIDAAEANEAGPNGFDGNKFSDRHYGGTNYLFQDFHAEWSTKMRERLARDWDMNGVIDIDEE